MGSSVVQIGCVAFIVVGSIFITVCCAVPSWVTLPTVQSTGIYAGPMTLQLGLWKLCVLEHQTCVNYGSVLNGNFGLLCIRSMIVISCLLTYVSFLILIILLILGFCANFMSCLQNANGKPKVRLGVGVCLLLAGLLLILSVYWFPHIFAQTQKFNMPAGSFIKITVTGSITLSKGACIYVGWAAGVLLLLGGGLLILFRKKDIP